MSGSALDLVPSKQLSYFPLSSKPERAIYLLDQALAKAGVAYFATVSDPKSAWFTIFVRKQDAGRAKAVIENIQRRTA